MRPAAGPEYVDRLEGSTTAKERAKAILQTLQGDLSVQEACRQLGICEQRFHQLREEMLQAAVARLEARPTGRPRRASEPEAVTALRTELAEAQLALRVAQLREEIALAMPEVVVPAGGGVDEASKKKPRRQARPGWWKK